jgi:hypothetical protein
VLRVDGWRWCIRGSDDEWSLMPSVITDQYGIGRHGDGVEAASWLVAGHCGASAGPCRTLRDLWGMQGRSRMTDRCTIQKSGLLCGYWGAMPTITASSCRVPRPLFMVPYTSARSGRSRQSRRQLATSRADSCQDSTSWPASYVWYPTRSYEVLRGQVMLSRQLLPQLPSAELRIRTIHHRNMVKIKKYAKLWQNNNDEAPHTKPRCLVFASCFATPIYLHSSEQSPYIQTYQSTNTSSSSSRDTTNNSRSAYHNSFQLQDKISNPQCRTTR